MRLRQLPHPGKKIRQGHQPLGERINLRPEPVRVLTCTPRLFLQQVVLLVKGVGLVFQTGNGCLEPLARTGAEDVHVGLEPACEHSIRLPAADQIPYASFQPLQPGLQAQLLPLGGVRFQQPRVNGQHHRARAGSRDRLTRLMVLTHRDHRRRDTRALRERGQVLSLRKRPAHHHTADQMGHGGHHCGVLVGTERLPQELKSRHRRSAQRPQTIYRLLDLHRSRQEADILKCLHRTPVVDAVHLLLQHQRIALLPGRCQQIQKVPSHLVQIQHCPGLGAGQLQQPAVGREVAPVGLQRTQPVPLRTVALLGPREPHGAGRLLLCQTREQRHRIGLPCAAVLQPLAHGIVLVRVAGHCVARILHGTDQPVPAGGLDSLFRRCQPLRGAAQLVLRLPLRLRRLRVAVLRHLAFGSRLLALLPSLCHLASQLLDGTGQPVPQRRSRGLHRLAQRGLPYVLAFQHLPETLLLLPLGIEFEHRVHQLPRLMGQLSLGCLLLAPSQLRVGVVGGPLRGMPSQHHQTPFLLRGMPPGLGFRLLLCGGLCSGLCRRTSQHLGPARQVLRRAQGHPHLLRERLLPHGRQGAVLSDRLQRQQGRGKETLLPLPAGTPSQFCRRLLQRRPDHQGIPRVADQVDEEVDEVLAGGELEQLSDPTLLPVHVPLDPQDSRVEPEIGQQRAPLGLVLGDTQMQSALCLARGGQLLEEHVLRQLPTLGTHREAVQVEDSRERPEGIPAAYQQLPARLHVSGPVPVLPLVHPSGDQGRASAGQGGVLPLGDDMGDLLVEHVVGQGLALLVADEVVLRRQEEAEDQ
ncbi:hypothetical protein AMK30_32425 [Streptomyces sp. CB02460]|nr:hypothetical protein AMK30_32425 [Streptomyces sp. CB02460]